jgi:hypothetical protein
MDLGLRLAEEGAQTTVEARLGLTFDVSLFR